MSMVTSFAALRQHFSTLPAKRLFAIADAAQNAALPEAIAVGAQHQCLFGQEQGTPLFKVAPHLVQIEDHGPESRALRWITHNAVGKASVTLLESSLSFDALATHLRQHLDLRLDDGEEKFLAFWDPAILATLVGQADDTTLYVPGPILSPAQMTSLLGPISSWWYWDRGGALHTILVSDLTAPASPPPWTLTTLQVDQLVEASVPDHVLSYLELNQPQLIGTVDTAQRYTVVRQHLLEARQLKLETMGDLVNYLCAALIYKERLQQDAAIGSLLARVKQGEITLTQALELMP